MAVTVRGTVCLCLLALCAGGARGADDPGYMKLFSDEETDRPHVQAPSIRVPDDFVDGSWHSIVAASDGNTYFTVASHAPGRSAQFYRYNPGADKIVRLGDAAEACGRGGDVGIVSSLLEADGKLYCVADAATRAPEPGPVGGGFLVYDLKTGKFQCLAPLPGRRGGRPTVLYEPVLGRIYVLLPGDRSLVYCDVATGEVTVVGALADNPEICRTLISDERGNVYSSTWGGVVCRYDPQARQMGCLLTRLPHDPAAPQPRPDPSELAWRLTRWGPMVWDPVGKWFYGVRGNDECLFRLRTPEPGSHRAEVETVGPIGFRASEVQPRYAGLGLALKGRTLYYCSYPLCQPEAHLMSCDLETRKVTDHGPIITDGRRRVSEIHSLVVGSEGLLHAVAMVWSIEGEDPTNAWAERADCYYHARLLRIDPEQHFK